MSKLDTLKAKLSSIQSDITVYDQEIEQMKGTIDTVIVTLKDGNIGLNNPIWNKLSGYNSTYFSSLKSKLPNTNLKNNETIIIDYSASSSDLSLKESININNKNVNIYFSNKNDSLYVITDGLTSSERKQLTSLLKNHISDDQMAIVTYHGDYYKYDSNDKYNCTYDYSVVGKTSNGKMYALQTVNNSEIVVDNGGNSDTLITTLNGMIIANKMVMTLETDAELNINVRPKTNIEGGQTVTEFTRLSFSGGISDSLGSEYATVYMKDDWQKYANTKENQANNTWLNEHSTKNVVTIGNGPQGSYANKYNSVGHVEEAVIPVIIKAGNKAGSQSMQGTVCYHHDGERPGYMSKDMLKFSQKIVSNWDSL